MSGTAFCLLRSLVVELPFKIHDPADDGIPVVELSKMAAMHASFVVHMLMQSVNVMSV